MREWEVPSLCDCLERANANYWNLLLEIEPMFICPLVSSLVSIPTKTNKKTPWF
jgi:hypothetical protein